MAPSKWEVWLVNMPFEEGIGEKVRPALVIEPRGIVVLVGKMTSHAPRKDYPYEYAIIDWSGAGLRCETTLRLSQRPELSLDRFIRRLGALKPTDQINVRLILEQIQARNSG